MRRSYSALNFSTVYSEARGLQLKLLLEMDPGRLFGREMGLAAPGGPELCYLFYGDMKCPSDSIIWRLILA